MNRTATYWNTTPIEQLDSKEWELLCDGCGKCCLRKLQNEETDEIFYTRVACRVLDIKSGRCSDCGNRLSRVPDCMDVSKITEAEMKWLPSSCAYRLRAESKPLPEWHPLISGHISTASKDPHHIHDRVLLEHDVPEENLEDYIIRQINT